MGNKIDSVKHKLHVAYGVQAWTCDISLSNH